jgi:RNA polymerase-binding transcription factor DksA
MLVMQVDRALRKMQDGIYGVSICPASRGFERLRAIPGQR